MAKSISTANAILTFIDKLKTTNDTFPLAKVIADSYSVSESSPEFYFLLHSLSDNFSRLLAQIDLAQIGDPAKNNFTKQTKRLAGIVSYQSLGQRYNLVKKESIDPNRVMLTYVDDNLRQVVLIDDDLENKISSFVAQLEAALNELLQADIPPKLKGYLQIQVSRLIFMLKNIDSFSGDQLWEQSVSTCTKLYISATQIKNAPATRAVSVIVKIGTGLMALLAAAEFMLDKSVSIGKLIKEGQELTENWGNTDSKALPDKKSSDIAH